ncbi:MAG TPA: AraC family transcriptional regulator [Microbacterium sp.]|nr:AraC family transcriptional regulator [Microbacterium sp.]
MPDGRVASIPSVSIEERRHDDRVVLLWQARGSSTCVLTGETRRLIAGHALWIPAGTAHALNVAPDSVVIPLHLPMRLQPAGLLTGPTWVAVDAELRTAILALLQVQTSIIRPDVDLERRLVRMIPERVVRPTGLAMPVSTPALEIALCLRDDPGEERSLAEIAAAHHVSVRTVERAFLSETGLSPQAWRTQRRMEVAAGLLARRMTPSFVAHRTGYASVSAFRRAFKRQYGIVPSEYAMRHAGSR